VIGHRWPIYMALAPVDLRLGSECLGSVVCEPCTEISKLKIRRKPAGRLSIVGSGARRASP
jgi:hypothetical protein